MHAADDYSHLEGNAGRERTLQTAAGRVEDEAVNHYSDTVEMSRVEADRLGQIGDMMITIQNDKDVINSICSQINQFQITHGALPLLGKMITDMLDKLEQCEANAGNLYYNLHFLEAFEATKNVN